MTRMRLGEFDPVSLNPYAEIKKEAILSPAHRQLAITAAIKSFVLLKNDAKTLPIPRGKIGEIAVKAVFARCFCRFRYH